MKKGDRVEFKTPSGKIIKGIYEGKTEQRAIIKGGKKTYKPPLKLVKKSKAETPKPKPKKAKKEDEVRPVDKKVPNIPLPKKTTGEIKKPKETLPDTLPTTQVAISFETIPKNFDELKSEGWEQIIDHPNHRPRNITERIEVIMYKRMKKGQDDELLKIIRRDRPKSVFAFTKYGPNELGNNEFTGERVIWEPNSSRKYPLDDVQVPQHSKSEGIYFRGKDFERRQKLFKMTERRKARQKVIDKYKKVKVAELRTMIGKDKAKGLKKSDILSLLADKEAGKPIIYDTL